MNDPEDKEEKRGFKVDDRRRFSETGETRPEQRDAEEPAAAAPPEQPVTPPPGPTAQPERRETPPMDINFSTFVISLSTQALVHLGEIPDPLEKKIVTDLGAAKQMIDILGVLNDKTKGNLDASETRLLESILYDLRLKYVERVRGRS